jgi:hypothetical protein
MKPLLNLLYTVLIGLLLIPGTAAQQQEISKKGEEVGPVTSTAGSRLTLNPNFGKIPLYFIPNKGQVNEKAKFYAKTSRYTLWMTKEGLVFDSARKVEVKAEVEEGATQPVPLGHPSQEVDTPRPLRGHPSQEGIIERDVSRLVLLKANKNPVIVPLEITQHKVNYYIGSDPGKWQKGISTSKAVLYKDIYKNIDLKVYGNESQVEYDWIVKPGGNPADIRFEYKNVKGARIDKKGNLLIKTKFGELLHKKPVSFQEIGMAHSAKCKANSEDVGAGLRACPKERKYVDVTFKKFAESTYGFKVHEFSKDYELIIDPVVSLEYSTYLGGRSDEIYIRMCVDEVGQVHMTGCTYSNDFPIKNAYQGSRASSSLDGSLIKFDSSGSDLIFSTYFGGSSDEYCTSITISDNGDIYIAGDTFSSDLPAINSRIGGKDVYIACFDTSGDLLYARYLGGTNEERITDIVLDNSNHLWAAGWTRSSNFPTVNPFQSTLSGSASVYVSKLTSDLSGIEYSTYLGGSGEDIGPGIKLDNYGYFYVAGRTGSRDFPVKNAWQKTHGGGQEDIFLSKFKPDGSGLIFSTYLGGSGDEYYHRMALGNSGGIYIGGFTYSPDFPTINPYQEHNAGSQDVFISAFNSDGSQLIYSTYLGGTADDHHGALALDSSGYIYVSGTTYSSNFPTKVPFQSVRRGTNDAFLSILSPGGTDLVYSTFFGGSGGDRCLNIARDGSGNIYLAGETLSWDLPVLNSFQPNRGGGQDFFVARFSMGWNLTVQSTPDPGVPIAVTPNDANGNGDGNTNFTRTYFNGEKVTLTAPGTYSQKVFYRWTIDGVDDFNRTIQVTMNRDHTVSVEYQVPIVTYTLNVQSAPDTGVLVAVTPEDTNGNGAGKTNFTRIFNQGEIVTLTAPGNFNGKDFYQWTIDGTANFKRTVQVTMNKNHAVSVEYQVPVVTHTLGVQSTPDIGVLIAVTPGDNNGKGDGKTDFTRTYNQGEIVTLTAPGTFNGKDFYQWIIDGVENFNRTIQMTMDKDHAATAVYESSPAIYLSRTQLNFGACPGIATTGAQNFLIENTGGLPLNWTISDNATWLNCSPASGTNFGEVSVSVNGSGLAPGTYTGAVTVSDPHAENSPQIVTVTLTVYNVGDTKEPFGYFETPRDGVTVMSSIPVTGWVLDDIEVMSVKIYRQEGKDLVYIGDAVFVEGARPDVELAYPNYPKSYRAGWGYMMLTNFLSDGGNGTFILHAIAMDKEGNQVTLGTKTIYCDNAHAVKPFGAIDTPAQGGTASGSNYRNQGWVLTPLPNKIPEDGHTIIVWIDGIDVGKCKYNIYRSDIAALFPGYANSNGAMAYFDFDTTAYKNGVHTIQWTAVDNYGNVDGIGSRYFTSQNAGGSMERMAQSAGRTAAEFKVNLSQVPPDYFSPIMVKKGHNQNIKPQDRFPDETGNITIEIEELERIELQFSEGTRGLAPLSDFPGPPINKWKGFLVVGDQLRTLPIGSTFNPHKGIFSWQPGPGFVGTYRFIFLEEKQNSEWSKTFITVNILPKFTGGIYSNKPMTNDK